MTTQQIDRADSGEIPPPGEVTVRIVGETRTTLDTGEATQNLSPYLIPSGPFPIPLRHNTTTPQSLVTGHGYDPEAHAGPIINLDDTARFHVVDYAGPQSPPPPLPKPPPTKDDTERLWLDGVEADVNGELRPAPPKLRRSVPYVMPDDRAPWSAPRHAAPAPLWTRLAIAAGLALLLGSALALTVLAVFW